ncbi:hypothetical protein JOD03_001197 [Chryseomicrobium aureum]|nr:hypothetical protein [Chryseomicrobium aureum]
MYCEFGNRLEGQVQSKGGLLWSNGLPIGSVSLVTGAFFS